MTDRKTDLASSAPTRRGFLARGSAATLAGTALLTDAARARDDARGDDTLRVALIGCGGRGRGAAGQALVTDGSVKLVAMADAFEDHLDSALDVLTRQVGDRVDVPPERRFVGFDAYEKAVACDVDVVILATPPGFRPIHFEHAVNAGKHVFMEKPVAVDAPGVRRVLAAAEEAKKRNLKVGVGLQRRHSVKYNETVQRLRDGAIGKLVFLRCYWNSGGVWVRPREEGQTEMEYQMRNWYYFNWLCGDHIVEQHIHNLDVCNWVMGGPPVSAQGQGGREVRDGVDHGEIFDHHMVEFTYADGTKMLSQCRHIRGCHNSVSEHAHGSEGSADVSAGRIGGTGGWSWRFRGDDPDHYQTEHDVLFRAIREGRPHNEAEYGATSTMTSIFGRMATYSGKRLAWKDALASELDLSPSAYAWDADPGPRPDEQGLYPIPIPGITKTI
ncbi:MAG: Gfo/Idh/MocA family oxidoreductase [Planctomycetota bacterium]|jgi:predicted dehydrogenase|nr:Gfo/Idh/MocA family oxidoreductase [Planctomycetota bacterium]MDP6764232.1 Gfo/Idh/MocA family oxidoreductase [Planctomycetota bacterium]MDP6988388.1 Gfo/Idh/MocA family oxidoreductase [Planctomycetota bacterium]